MGNRGKTMTTENGQSVALLHPIVMASVPVRPYYSDDRVTIYHGDSRLIWPMLPKCDLLLTDPPYGIAFNATEQQLPGATERDRIKGDDDIELARWLCGMLWHAEEAVIFGANCFPQLLPHRGRWICWDKRITEAADKMLGSAFELAWCSRTSGFDRIVRKLHGGVVNADGGKRVHPTQKPSGLFKQIIGDMFPKAETIVDPFMGSGSVLLAAKLEGRKAIGIEVEEQYCEAAAKRLSQGVLF
jgi:site-specific DNA-methyltransferase (adenine-specific)